MSLLTKPVRTRFAPSPTGYLHIGGARTALFAWAFARHHQGQFILRIEDTDVERSTPESVQTILDGMQWLGLQQDEGPFYQMQRMARYKEVIETLLKAGQAYYCYASREELDLLRATQRANNEKPQYDGRWRDSTATPPAGVAPVVRFKNPKSGSVVWQDLVKGRIEIANAELDDLIIARADGTPTYNFCVVVDDLDMQISHVIRGDDHVNNTPRQINILQALGADLPEYAHLPMILRADGKKMSKRDADVVSVAEYADLGILPEALCNYLARLGWAHGNEEMFSRQQFIDWFSLEAITPSPARFDLEKLLWLNQQYLKALPSALLEEKILALLPQAPLAYPPLSAVIALLRERSRTLCELVEQVSMVYFPAAPTSELIAQHFTDASVSLLQNFVAKLEPLAETEWQAPILQGLIKAFMAEKGIKMPVLGLPLRLALFGTTHTPSLDVMLALLGRDLVLTRLTDRIASYK